MCNLDKVSMNRIISVHHQLHAIILKNLYILIESHAHFAIFLTHPYIGARYHVVSLHGAKKFSTCVHLILDRLFRS
jgi:hypothetical protein